MPEEYANCVKIREILRLHNKWVVEDDLSHEETQAKLEGALLAMVESLPSPAPQVKEELSGVPIPMDIFCPACGTRHIDEGEWSTRPHKTHQCQFCKEEWRFRTFPTVGVASSPAQPVGTPERFNEIVEWLENEAEERMKRAMSRRDCANTMRKATRVELREAEALAEKMSGHKLHGGSTSEESAKEGADMDDRIATRYETEARKLSGWADLLRAQPVGSAGKEQG